MHRYVARLLCAYIAAGGVAGGLLGAPTLFPRPVRQRGPWFDSWERVGARGGDCRFEGKGDKLTITVPGRGGLLDLLAGRANALRLRRDAEGDFVMQVGTLRGRSDAS
jgi:hypothetical protein